MQVCVPGFPIELMKKIQVECIFSEKSRTEFFIDVVTQHFEQQRLALAQQEKLVKVKEIRKR